MTEIKTDELARNAARNAIARHIEEMEPEAEGGYLADRLLNDIITTVTWETGVNAAGVPVRRYVLRGEWEVDPAPPVHFPRKGDVVAFLPEHDEDVATSGLGVVPAGSEWVVRSVPVINRTRQYALLFITQPEWPQGSYITATSKTVRIVRRTS